MNTFLSTCELESIIKGHYLDKLCTYLKQQVNLSNVFFEDSKDNNQEGIYVYTNENGYNYLFTERGTTRTHNISNDLFEIVYLVIENIVFDVALKYATENREENKDFRRKLFEKEKELWSILDEKGYLKKCLDIKNILEKNPFLDEQEF